MSNDRPRVKLQPGGDKRAMLGHPWIFSNELVMDAAAKALPPGEIVTLIRPDGRPLGAAFFNPHSLIAARLLTRDADRAIDESFLQVEPTQVAQDLIKVADWNAGLRQISPQRLGVGLPFGAELITVIGVFDGERTQREQAGADAAVDVFLLLLRELEGAFEVHVGGP